MSTTRTFAPAPEDLDEGYFDAAVMTFSPPIADDEESEQGEP